MISPFLYKRLCQKLETRKFNRTISSHSAQTAVGDAYYTVSSLILSKHLTSDPRISGTVWEDPHADTVLQPSGAAIGCAACTSLALCNIFPRASRHLYLL